MFRLLRIEYLDKVSPRTHVQLHAVRDGWLGGDLQAKFLNHLDKKHDQICTLKSNKPG